MANIFTTEKKMVYLTAVVAAETPVLDKIREDKSSDFVPGGGTTISIKAPSYPSVVDGMTGTEQDISFGTVTLELGSFNTSMSIGAIEESCDMEDYKKDYAEPAGVSIADFIDTKVINECMTNACSAVVVTAAPTMANLSTAHALVRSLRMGRNMVGFIDPMVKSALIGPGSDKFGTAPAEKMYRGELQEYDMVKYFENVIMPTFTMNNLPVAGTSKVTTKVDTNGTTSTSLIIDGLVHATNPVAKGTIFELTGINNPTAIGADSKLPHAFVVIEDSAAAVANVATVKVAPLFFKNDAGVANTTSCLQNVNVKEIAANTLVSAVKTPAGTYRCAFMFDSLSMVYAARKLPDYRGMTKEASANVKAGGVAIRMGYFPSSTNGSQKLRIDGLFGVKAATGKGIALVMVKQ